MSSSLRAGIRIFTPVLLLSALVWPLHAGGPQPLHPTIPDTMPGTLELDIIPHPASAKLRDEVLAVGRSRVWVPRLDALGIGRAQLEYALGLLSSQTLVGSADELLAEKADTLVVIGLEAWKTLADKLPGVPALRAKPLDEEAYVLHIVEAKDGRPQLILAAGGSLSAEYYAIQSLRQLSWRDGNKTWIRLGEVDDHPVFSIRGNKRFVSWMSLFKANLVNEMALNLPIQREIPLLYRFREYHPISYPPKPPKDVFNVAATVEGVLSHTRTPDMSHDFHSVVALMMDDIELTDAVTPEDRKKYGGYFEAIRAAVDQSAAAVAKKNPSARFWFMPQFYFSHMRDFAEGGKRFRASGPLSSDVGIYFNGAEVSCLFTPEAVVRDYVRNLGGDEKNPVTLYDTIFDTDESFFAVPAIAPHSASYLAGTILEQGNPINAGTYYDMLWNPTAYDTRRSEMLVCREVMGLRHWETLYRLITAYRELVLPPAHDIPRAEALARFEKSFAAVRVATGDLKKLRASDLAGRVDFSLLYERKGKRMYGRFELADFFLGNRPLTETEIAAMRDQPIARVLASGAIPEADVALAVSVDPQTTALVTSAGSTARVVGPVNFTEGPGGRIAFAFPGAPGTGVEVEREQDLASDTGWSVAWWMRGDAPEQLNVIMQVFQASDFQAKVLEVLTVGQEPGHAAALAGSIHGPTKVFAPLVRPVDGQWHHVVINQTTEGERACFLDGVKIATAPDPRNSRLAGRTVVLGGVPASANELAGVRMILRSWQDFIAYFPELETALQKMKPTIDAYFSRELVAPHQESISPETFAGAGLSKGFVPSARASTAGSTTLEAVHDNETIALRVRGPLPANGVVPQVQFYLDPSSDRSMAFQFNIPGTNAGDDPCRDFIQEGVAAGGAWAAFFSQKANPPQYTDFPIKWDWSRNARGGFYEVVLRVKKASLRQALGGAELNRRIGLQAFAAGSNWNAFLLWRGRIDPGVFGTLELLPAGSIR